FGSTQRWVVKKGQITLFVIIGLVLVILVAISLFIREAFVGNGDQSQIDESTNAAIRSISTFVTDCLKLSAEEAVLQAGLHGGVIYGDDGNGGNGEWLGQNSAGVEGCTLSNDPQPSPGEYNYYTHHYGCNDVPYVNVASSGSSDPVVIALMAKPGWWPPFYNDQISNSYPADGYDYLTSRKKDYFGINTLPPLCDMDGANAPGQGIRRFPCNPEVYDAVLTGNRSVQEQIEHSIEENIVNCIDFTSYEDKGMDITTGELVVRSTLGESDISFDMSYPIEINVNGKIAGNLDTFHTSIPVRLQSIYMLAWEMIERDIWDLGFDMEANRFDLDANKPEFSLSKQRQGNYYLWTITDAYSLLNGAPYVFRFATEARKPVLSLVADISGANQPTYCVQKNDITFYANDPDSDLVSVDWDSSYGVMSDKPKAFCAFLEADPPVSCTSFPSQYSYRRGGGRIENRLTIPPDGDGFYHISMNLNADDSTQTNGAPSYPELKIIATDSLDNTDWQVIQYQCCTYDQDRWHGEAPYCSS
ncbi:MAG: hypothetical protein ABIH41_02320, partial [Nanoarchaeota archaeon]